LWQSEAVPMSIFARRRSSLAVLGVAVLVALALGLAVGRHGTGSALAQGPAGVLAQGSFRTVSWGTTGKATIVRDASGRVTLRLSRDFRTQRAPELFVHLGSKRMLLQSASGSQAYVLSSASPATLRATVQIFCEKCNKAWGEATLRPTARSAA
jgi:hypothetical protein